MADKFEREIEEIIRNAGDGLPPPPRSARRAVRRAKPPRRRWQPAIKAGPIMLASVALLLAGVLLWNVSNGLGGMIMLGAVILFLLSYLLFFGRWATGGSGGYEKRWRGQPINEGPPLPPLGARLRGWLRRTRYRRN